MNDSIVFLNGTYIPIDQAHISVMDRGFMFGDGVYEVISVFHGNMIGVEGHLERIEQSLNSIYMQMPFSKKKLKEIFTELLKKNKTEEKQLIYLQITRGVAYERTYIPNKDIKPTVFAMTYPMQIKSQKNGVKVITVPDFRWQRCDIKALNRLANIILSYQASEALVDDIIIKLNDQILEGASSNIFIVKNNIIYTPKLSPHLLKGITREIIIEIAQQHTIPCKEQDISITDLLNSDEAWLTSSAYEITPIIEVDGHLINGGKIGPVYRKMIDLYHEYIANLK